jgi:DNA-binding NtrC family response regulator
MLRRDHRRIQQGKRDAQQVSALRIIHDSGPRARGPFNDVNGAAIPDTMLEAELFG